MASLAPRLRTCARFLLGVFIAGQLLFLVAGNIVPFILDGLSTEAKGAVKKSTSEHRPETLARSVSEGDGFPSLTLRTSVEFFTAPKASVVVWPLQCANALTDGWIQFTGQGQGWRLFAPQVQTRALFLSVTTEVKGPPPALHQLPSFCEPASPEWFFHVPGSGDRLFHVEKEVYWLPMVAWDPEQIRKDPHGWHNYVVASVRDRWRRIRTYLAWRIRGEPGPPPEVVYLSVHVYPLSAAGRRIVPADIVTVPLVRWRPAWQPPEGYLPIEVYNEETGAYQPIPVKGDGA